MWKLHLQKLKTLLKILFSKVGLPVVLLRLYFSVNLFFDLIYITAVMLWLVPIFVTRYVCELCIEAGFYSCWSCTLFIWKPTESIMLPYSHEFFIFRRCLSQWVLSVYNWSLEFFINKIFLDFLLSNLMLVRSQHFSEISF